MKKIFIMLIVAVCICVMTVVILKGGRAMDVKVDGGTIYGELIDCSKDVVVVLVAGSGPTDRNGNSEILTGRNDNFLQLATELKKKGISTFRYDKRTAGGTVKTIDTTKQIYFENFVDDLNACIKKLKELGYKKVILVGHSQGSLVSMLSAKSEEVDGLISVSGPAFNIGDTMIEQYRNSLGEDAEQIKYFQMLMNGETDEKAEEVDPLFNMNNQRFLLGYMKYEPKDIIKELDIPVMIVQGEADLQTSIDDFNTLVDAYPNAQSKLIDNMNHVLKNIDNEDDNIKSYQDPSYELHDELVTAIVAFIKNGVVVNE